MAEEAQFMSFSPPDFDYKNALVCKTIFTSSDFDLDRLKDDSYRQECVIKAKAEFSPLIEIGFGGIKIDAMEFIWRHRPHPDDFRKLSGRFEARAHSQKP
jgi:hypothetical protein